MPKRPTAGGDQGAAGSDTAARDIERLLDDVEDAMLAGDEARGRPLVEKLWGVRRQLPEVLTQRLIGGRSRIPVFTFDLLSGFAGAKTPSFLKRVAANANVHDIVRFGARRRAGWSERGEAKQRLRFLETLRDPDATLLEATAQGGTTWPPQIDVLTEVLGYLTALPSDRRQALTTAAAVDSGARASWLLHALLHIDDAATARTALAELVRRRDLGSVGPVRRLAQTATDDDMRAEAAAAAQRLGLQVVGGREQPAPLPLPPVEFAMASIIDGSGGQAIIITRRLDELHSLFTDIFWNDEWGIKGVFGSVAATADTLQDIISRLEDEGVYLVDVDPAALRGILALAVEANTATGHGIPPEFELWEPLLHDTYPPVDDGLPLAVQLDDNPYANRPDLVKKGRRLADHPFCETWGFEEARTLTAMQTSPPPASNKLGERQYRPLIEQLVDDAVKDTFRRRLRRQAWLLEQDGDEEFRDIALATSAHLATAPLADLVKQPFLRRLVDRSVSQTLTSVFVMRS